MLAAFQQHTPNQSQFPLWSRLCLLAGLALLAWEPAQWLWRSWVAPAYDSQGEFLAIAVLALLVWSASSPLVDNNPAPQKAWWLLLATALLRLVGQLLAINVIGALALVVDVYALGLLLRLPQRQRALSPFWLAMLFAGSLPLEMLLQRVGGYALQQTSAQGACLLLQLAPDAVQCFGNRIVLAGRDVLVDLPCSGARGLLLLIAVFCGLSALRRPSIKMAIAGLLVVLAAAWIGNAVRLALLAAGWAYPQLFFAADVMAEPWHELIGTGALLLSGLPLVLWVRRIPEPARSLASEKASKSNHSLPQFFSRPLIAALFPLCAVAIVLTPGKPIDVAKTSLPTPLPAWVGGYSAEPSELTAKEQRYFVRYGGNAQRAYFGPHTLLRVSTTAPLRHLHPPTACLSGNGNSLRYVGASYAQMPSSVYLLTDANGDRFRVNVSFVSDRGEWALNVAEVAWRWLASPGTRWTMLQRIGPWAEKVNNGPWAEKAEANLGTFQTADIRRTESGANATATAFSRWEQALPAALDLPLPQPSAGAEHKPALAFLTPGSDELRTAF